ncbi:MAG: DUF86 domain-containing protein [Chitinispirillales bacterium]|jgi:uncharacterized protein with HEPN domain|nr:DUF86 domain-containing protein [Chitinispirillales bacterium]
MKKHEAVILKKMKTYAKQAIEFKGDIDFEEFTNDYKTISACVFNLSQIGELVGKLDETFINSTSHVPWKKIKGMRNKIVHDYEGIQYNIVWDVLITFLPKSKLIEDIDKLMVFGQESL